MMIWQSSYQEILLTNKPAWLRPGSGEGNCWDCGRKVLIRARKLLRKQYLMCEKIFFEIKEKYRKVQTLNYEKILLYIHVYNIYWICYISLLIHTVIMKCLESCYATHWSNETRKNIPFTLLQCFSFISFYIPLRLLQLQVSFETCFALLFPSLLFDQAQPSPHSRHKHPPWIPRPELR